MTNKDEIREDDKYKKLNFMLDRLVKGVDYVGDPDLSYTLDLEEFTHVELLQLILNYFSEYNDSRLFKVVKEITRSQKYRGDGDFSDPAYCNWYAGYREAVTDIKKSLLNETKEDENK